MTLQQTGAITSAATILKNHPKQHNSHSFVEKVLLRQVESVPIEEIQIDTDRYMFAQAVPHPTNPKVQKDALLSLRMVEKGAWLNLSRLRLTPFPRTSHAPRDVVFPMPSTGPSQGAGTPNHRCVLATPMHCHFNSTMRLHSLPCDRLNGGIGDNNRCGWVGFQHFSPVPGLEPKWTGEKPSTHKLTTQPHHQAYAQVITHK